MEEKNEVKTLKEKLFTRREHGAKVLSKEEMKNSQDFSVGYKDFLNKSKTESEAVAYVLEKAKKFGFEKFEMGKSYKPGDKIFARTYSDRKLFKTHARKKNKSSFANKNRSRRTGNHSF